MNVWKIASPSTSHVHKPDKNEVKNEAIAQLSCRRVAEFQLILFE